MIIDAHNHIGERKGLKLEAEELIRQMDSAGIDMAVVFSFVENIDNDYVARSVASFPDRLIGFGVVNPWQEDSTDEVKRSIEELGFAGIKLHPTRHGYSFDNHLLLDPIFSLCEQYDVPIIAHGACDVRCVPNMFEEMANTFPEVKLMMAHSGQMYETKSAIGVAERTTNIILETSTVFSLRLANQVEKLGARRIVMGTDTPKGDFSMELKKIYSVVNDKEERSLITGGNIARILRLDGGAE